MKRITPVVAACILQRYPLRILLHRKGKTRNPTSHLLAGKWELPGGVMEYGETPEQALKREIREELGIIIQVNRLLHAKTNIYDDRKHYLVLYYVCQTGYKPAPDNCKYFAAEEIRGLDCLLGTYEVIDKISVEYS